MFEPILIIYIIESMNLDTFGVEIEEEAVVGNGSVDAAIIIIF